MSRITVSNAYAFVVIIEHIIDFHHFLAGPISRYHRFVFIPDFFLVRYDLRVGLIVQDLLFVCPVNNHILCIIVAELSQVVVKFF